MDDENTPTTTSTTSGIDEILDRWRNEVKGKQRRIISFEETVDIKIRSIRKLVHPQHVPIEGWSYRRFIYTSKRERNFIDDAWQPIGVGDTWGGPDMSALFRCTTRMPAEFKGQKVVMKLYFGGDGLLRINGVPTMGMDPFRDTIPLTDCARGNETYELELESYIFWHFGEGTVKRVEASEFATVDTEMNDTFWDFRAVHSALTSPYSAPELVDFLAAGLRAAVRSIDQNEPDRDTARANALVGREILRNRVYETDRFKQDGLIHLCGHSHLDVVFLWTHAEFVRKLGRTHANTLRLMEEYPDYIFSQSQPLMYAEMKATYPELYEQVKARVKEGRWEVIGAMWVEPDCNVLSGESFVRQILHGMRFIMQEFGVRPLTCWCPDVFGNAWSMPQIIARAGLKYFITHKMVVWNDTNPWVKNTFWWQGPDGSRVLALVPPTHFIGTLEPDHLQEHWGKFSDRQTIAESVYCYGWGDGGGGPDAEMLEYMKRFDSFPGLPASRPARIEDALASIHEKAIQHDMPVWNDELYLEEHRGIQTTKGSLKKANRTCERIYREAELWSVAIGGDYPQDELDRGWKIILTNQFHDSLPGSHINQVYHDLCEAYDEALTIGNGIRDGAAATIASRIDTTGPGAPLVVFNSLGHARSTLVTLDMAERVLHVVDDSGNVVAHQFTTDLDSGLSQLLFLAAHLPPAGFRVYHLVDGDAPAPAPDSLSVTTHTLANEHVQAVLNSEGELISLIEAASGREFIHPDKRGNVLKLYEDVPGKYEAWDIAPSYTDVDFDISGATTRVVEQGPVRAAIEVERTFGQSHMKQRISLTADSARIAFDTWVDWHEQQKLLKTRFFTPLQTRMASYDIAFANMERSTYFNNSFDEAKFEVPAHRWMDISQPDRGLSLLNDCKYGHEAFDSMIALSLLRGPTVPDEQSDQEEHRFTYAVLPHAGTWRDGGTEQSAADLNTPAQVVLCDAHEGDLKSGHSFIAIDPAHVTLEAVKRAEDSEATIIRLVERYGTTTDVTVTFPQDLASVIECNLLEEDESSLPAEGSTFRFTIKPYEIRTFKLQTVK